MATVERELNRAEARARETADEYQYETWKHWPVNWSAVWVGALAAFCVMLIFGLCAIAVGAHLLAPEQRVVDLSKVSIWATVFNVCGAFFSFVIGAWAAVKIAGILHSEPAILHGAIVWLVAVPLIVAAAALGAANYFGGWNSGLAGAPAWATGASAAPYLRPEAPGVNASTQDTAAYQTQLAEYGQKVRQWNEDAPKAARNSALGAVTALLVGLIGSVIGGWMAAGEPMTFTHYHTRRPLMRHSV
jgi:hypothetical protein